MRIFLTLRAVVAGPSIRLLMIKWHGPAPGCGVFASPRKVDSS
jgi:hypothetical protein